MRGVRITRGRLVSEGVLVVWIDVDVREVDFSDKIVAGGTVITDKAAAEFCLHRIGGVLHGVGDVWAGGRRVGEGRRAGCRTRYSQNRRPQRIREYSTTTHADLISITVSSAAGPARGIHRGGEKFTVFINDTASKKSVARTITASRANLAA